MESSDYSQLIEFLGKNFEKVDERFEKIDEKFEDISRQNGILNEATQHKLDLILEELQMHKEKNERDKKGLLNTDARLEMTDISLRADIDDHERRIGMLEKKA